MEWVGDTLEDWTRFWWPPSRGRSAFFFGGCLFWFVIIFFVAAWFAFKMTGWLAGVLVILFAAMCYWPVWFFGVRERGIPDN